MHAHNSNLYNPHHHHSSVITISSRKVSTEESTMGVLIFLAVILSLVVAPGSCDDSSSLQTKCSPELTKLMMCLDYATAKSDTPSTECCTSATGIRDRDPACLCYIIQQASKGGPNVQSLGLKFDRLLSLPQACKIPNSNVADCPKYLNLSPRSPDAAIFSNTTKATTPSVGTPITTTSTKSEGVVQQIHVARTFAIAMVSAIFLFFFSV